MAKTRAKTISRCPEKVIAATPNKIGRRFKPNKTKAGARAKRKTYVPDKKNAHSQSNSEVKAITGYKPPGTTWCILCRKDFLKKEAHDHFESMLHHRELESILGRDCIHFCQLCPASVLGLEQYASHITTPHHKAKMKRRNFKKPIYPDNSLCKDILLKLKDRNKRLKKEEAKEKNKLKKYQKQLNGCESLKEKAAQPKPWEKPKALAQLLNKEIRLACSLHPGQSPVQLHLGGLHLQSGEPSGDGCEPHSEHLGTSQPGPREAPPCSSAPASTLHGGKSNAAGPIESADVGLLLCEIRRALGEMEPCRAERAACSKAEVQGEAPGAAQQSTLEKQGPKCDSYKDKHSPFCSVTEVGKYTSSSTLQSQHVSTSISKPASGRQSSERSTNRTKNKALIKELADDATLRTGCVISESDGPTTVDQASQGISASFIRHLDKTPTHEPNTNFARSCYDVSELRKFKVEKETGFKLNFKKQKVVSQRKVKRQEIKGLSKFGIELSNPLSNHEVLTPEGDHPLSEGFQWELAFPDGPSPATVSLHQDVAVHALATKCKADVTVHCTGLPSIAMQEKGPTQAGGPARVKMEAYAEVQQVNVKPTKRKRKLQNGESLVISSEGPGGKKLNTKKDQVHVDNLLAVSLKEEELSRSLQEVDNFLVQARSALQAAYTEVQRLLLLKQQVSAEVNSLRAKRIEILQGMQGGFSATPSLGEKDCRVPTPTAMAIIPVKHEPSTHQHNSLRNTRSPLAAAGALLMPSIASPMPHSQVLHTFSRGPSVSPVVLPTLLPSPSALAATVALPAMASHGMQWAQGSMSTTVAYPRPTEQNLNIPRRRKNTRESEQSSDSDSEEVLEGVGKPVTAPTKGSAVTTIAPDQRHSGGDSDCSLEMVELTPGSGEVVAIDSDSSSSSSSSSDSESEDTSEDDHLVRKAASHASAQPASSQNTDSKNNSSSSTQTSLVKLKEDNIERIIELPTVADVTNEKLGSFQGHAGPIHGLQVHGGILYTCSGDNTARAYSLKSKECQAVYEGHTSKVNCLLVSSPPGLPTRLYTGSSDQTIRRYSIKTNKCLEQICLPERVLCMHASGRILYVGLANGTVFSFDLKTQKQLNVFECHVPRGVSCLGTSQEGARRLLLVGSYDSTISVRDAKSGLLLRTLQGHTKTVLCMIVVNDLVFSGSSDTSVHAHNIHTGELVRIYKGHGHAVTSLAILGKVMVTSCLDKLVRVYELQSHDRLQVYGGHNDMVMCMAINNSVIYTGCYDGSIQAVKLNLIKNYRCWWHGCSLIFGIAEHLHQHLLSVHSSPTQQTLKCRWRNCDAFFSKPDTIRLDLPGHMQHHVEADSRMET